MNPLLNEELRPLAAVARMNPATRNVCPRTVTRWAQSGVRGVKLESLRVGDRLMTSAEALSRFLSALNLTPAADESAPRSAAERQKASEQAAKELLASGA